MDNECSGYYIQYVKHYLFTILHSEASLRLGKASARLAVILVLLIKGVSLEKLADAVEKVDWERLRGVLLIGS